jgi:hypothetical protein
MATLNDGNLAWRCRLAFQNTVRPGDKRWMSARGGLALTNGKLLFKEMTPSGASGVRVLYGVESKQYIVWRSGRG